MNLKKLGKYAKGMLILGLCTLPVSGVLYACSIPVIATPILVGGIGFIFIGVPYVDGVESPIIKEEKINNHNVELLNKRNYVQSNMKTFGIGSQQKTVSENERDKAIIDSLGSKGVERIINDTTPFPEYVYRPNPDCFVKEQVILPTPEEIKNQELADKIHEVSEKIHNDQKRLEELEAKGHNITQCEHLEKQRLKHRISINSGILFQLQNPEYASEEVRRQTGVEYDRKKVMTRKPKFIKTNPHKK